MQRPRLRLLCDTNPMCYGSSTALLSVLDHLDASRTALVRDVTAEVLGRDPSVDAVVSVDTKNPSEVRSVLNPDAFDAVLVISNQANVEVYRELGLPIFFVDILYWFGQRKDQRVWGLAERSFVQAFPGVAERLATGVTPGQPEIVGPLIRNVPRVAAQHAGTLAQIGGARSRLIQPGVDSSYPRMVVDWLTAVSDALPSPITLACGDDAARVAGAHPEAAKFNIGSLPQPLFLEALGTSALYVTAPGLNAVFEGLLAGGPMLLFPPQNATQVAQLMRYEAAGIVAPGINLTELDPRFPRRPDTLPEVQLTEAVLASLRRLDSADARRAVEAHLRLQLREVGARAPAREGFMESLGAPGGVAVADGINRWWSEQWM